MNTAVDDGIVFRNPCRVRGAAQDRSPERSVLTVREVGALVETIPERYRALVLLAVFGSLRWGELAALRRCDVDLTQGTVRVERSLTELGGGGYLYGPPKSAAGRRVVVVIPAARGASDGRAPPECRRQPGCRKTAEGDAPARTRTPEPCSAAGSASP